MNIGNCWNQEYFREIYIFIIVFVLRYYNMYSNFLSGAPWGNNDVGVIICYLNHELNYCD